MAKTVIFRNYSDETFVWYWNSEKYVFKPGMQVYMEEWKASHFAKHLANRELQKRGFVMDTSPKRPGDNVRFMEFFNQAFVEEEESEDELSDEKAADDVLNRNKGIDVRVEDETEGDIDDDEDGDEDAPLSPTFSEGAPSMPAMPAPVMPTDDDQFEGK